MFNWQLLSILGDYRRTQNAPRLRLGEPARFGTRERFRSAGRPPKLAWVQHSILSPRTPAHTLRTAWAMRFTYRRSRLPSQEADAPTVRRLDPLGKMVSGLGGLPGLHHEPRGDRPTRRERLRQARTRLIAACSLERPHRACAKFLRRWMLRRIAGIARVLNGGEA
jgi:hypothetical protein